MASLDSCSFVQLQPLSLAESEDSVETVHAPAPVAHERPRSSVEGLSVYDCLVVLAEVAVRYTRYSGDCIVICLGHGISLRFVVCHVLDNRRLTLELQT